MITFSGMVRFRSQAYALLTLASFVLPGAAKSPEEFVGPAAAADTARPHAAAHGALGPRGEAPGKPAPSGQVAVSPKGAAAKPVAKAPLDTARIHNLYLDGDFDQATHGLEAALRGKKPLSHADSVFAFKHLGVMYAATPATREKGRYYMLQLISIEPTAKILDMYASDMIYLIFRNVQEEYENKRGKTATAAPAADTVAARPVASAAAPRKDSLPAPAPAAARPASDRNRTLYWAAGGAAVAAGAIGLAFILFDDPQPKKRNIILAE